MRRLLPLLLPCALLAPRTADAQAKGNVRDTPLAMWIVTASYAYQVPSGDLSYRFGNNNNIGILASRKLANGYFFGVDGGFLFGNRINETSLLRDILTADGSVLDKDGQPATVFLYERGYTVMGHVGKLLPIAGPNPNSGMVLRFGAGYMRHKIRLETQQNEVPQIEGEYLKGYDHLCAGPAFSFLLAYQHISSNRLVNFMVGFESTFGFTRSLRPYNFDTGPAGDEVRTDILHGLRVGWSLPIYRRLDDTYYTR